MQAGMPAFAFNMIFGLMILLAKALPLDKLHFICSLNIIQRNFVKGRIK